MKRPRTTKTSKMAAASGWMMRFGRRQRRPIFVFVGIVALMGLIAGASVALARVPVSGSPLGILAASVSALFLVALGTRLVLWWRYRPVELTPAERRQLPTMTVVIPAFNEGPMVRRSIESVLTSRYPVDRLQVIVVNDGSSDDTGAHIDAVADLHPDRVTAIHLPKNRGKRH